MRLTNVRIASLLALAVCSDSRPANAQGVFGPGASYLGAGVSGIGTGNLEDRLAARGYPTFGRTAAGVGIGTYHILPGGLTVGGEWNGLILGEKDHQGNEVGIGGGYGTLGLGYMVELSPRIRIYPRFGLGGGGMGLWIERDSGAVGFDDVLANPKPIPEKDRDPVLSRVSVVVDLGFGAEFLPGGWGRGLMVGLRLGYLAAPSSTSWQMYDQTVSDGPAVSIGGPYIKGMIGVGRRR